MIFAIYYARNLWLWSRWGALGLFILTCVVVFIDWGFGLVFLVIEDGSVWTLLRIIYAFIALIVMIPTLDGYSRFARDYQYERDRKKRMKEERARELRRKMEAEAEEYRRASFDEDEI